MKRPLAVLLALASVLLAARALAQEPTPAPTFRTGVDVIAVDVAAFDQRGRPVADLLAPDFDVKVDGQPRSVVSVQLVRADEVAAAAARADDGAFDQPVSSNISQPTGRMFVLAVDELHIPPGNLRPVLSAAGRFLDGLSRLDTVAFFAYPAPGRSVDFTSDRARVKRAMDLTVGNQLPSSGLSRFNVGLYEAYQIAERSDDVMFAKVLIRECPRLTGPALDECTRELIGEIQLMVATTRNETTSSLAGLRNILIQLAAVDGPKTLLLFSEGLVLDNPADLADTIRLAMLARVTVHVLMLDAQRNDISQARMRPTMTEDRAMRESGLEDLAAQSRGSIYRVIGTGEGVFERIAAESAAYYLLGVEEGATDRDDKTHRIDVAIRRRGVTIRSRRAFVLASASKARRKPEEQLVDVLRSPVAVSDLPLRLTTFVSQPQAGGKLEVVLAAEVGQAGAAAETFTVGYVAVDGEGKLAASRAEAVRLSPAAGSTGRPLEYLAAIQVDPGIYSLRFGVIDASGRRGSVVRELRAWQIEGEPFAVGDLVVGSLPGDDRRVRPGVEPHVAGDVLAYVDLYASAPATFEAASVALEIAETPDGPALLAIQAPVGPGRHAGSRVAGGALAARLLPPGRYLARARIARAGAPAGTLIRPFVVEPGAAGGLVSMATPDGPIPGFTISLGRVAPFDPTALAGREILGPMFDQLAQRSAPLKDAVAEARASRYGAAAVEALAAGDQEAAAFLKGLDWYFKGQLDQAVNQLTIAAGPRRTFFPAALYLGASFAAAGRDTDAAGVWQLGLGTEPRPPTVYVLLADARLRTGQAQAAVDVLQPAYQRLPTDDDIGRRLAAAYLLVGRVADAVRVLDGYLSRHMTDQDALFAAVVARYSLSMATKVTLPESDLARLAAYTRAYTGTQRPLLDKYVAVLRR